MASELRSFSGYYERHTAHDMDYRQFMEKQAMVKDIGAEIRRSADQQTIASAIVGAKITSHIDQSAVRMQASMARMSAGIQKSINAQTFAIIASNAALNRTMETGFSNISNQLGEMTAAFTIGFQNVQDAIERMTVEICKRLDALHDIMNNPLLTQSREHYRRAVVNANKGFFEEALEDIKEAVGKNKTDYISWFLEGKIYSFGVSEFSNMIGLDNAITALTSAAKYISPDIAGSDDARLMAAEIYFDLGLATYAKSNDLLREQKNEEAGSMLAGARAAFEKSYGYSGKMLEAAYNIARCDALMGNTGTALSYLEKVILEDRAYCIKVFADSDFESILKPFTSLIEKLKNDIYPRTREYYDWITANLAEFNELGGMFPAGQLDYLSQNLPKKFSPNMSYFEVRDGHEVFPEIIRRLDGLLSELQAQIKKRQDAESETRRFIDRVKADIEKIRKLSEENEWLNKQDWVFVTSKANEYFIGGGFFKPGTGVEQIIKSQALRANKELAEELIAVIGGAIEKQRNRRASNENKNIIKAFVIAPLLLIASIVLGVIVHSFLAGLIGSITAVALFFAGIMANPAK